jgi:hypothetical protein
MAAKGSTTVCMGLRSDTGWAPLDSGLSPGLLWVGMFVGLVFCATLIGGLRFVGFHFWSRLELWVVLVLWLTWLKIRLESNPILWFVFAGDEVANLIGGVHCVAGSWSWMVGICCLEFGVASAWLGCRGHVGSSLIGFP